jgi:hypothetical protein
MSPAHFEQMGRRRTTADRKRDARDLVSAEQSTWYRTVVPVVGITLWFSSRCRPDIAVATHYLARSMSEPAVVHVAAAVHLLRYLRNTHGHGLYFQSGYVPVVGGPPWTMVIHHDATFASDRNDSSSVAGIAVFLMGVCIYWRTHKIKAVTRSSTDAELYGADYGLRFVEDFKQLLRAIADLSNVMRPLLPACVACITDNMGLKDLVGGVNDNADTSKRHIRMRLDHLRQAVQNDVRVRACVCVRACACARARARVRARKRRPHGNLCAPRRPQARTSTAQFPSTSKA